MSGSAGSARACGWVWLGHPERRADVPPRKRGLGRIEPLGRRSRALAPHNLNHIAIPEYGVEGDELAVDLRPRKVLAELTVNGGGEVNGGGARGEVNNISLGGEDEDAVGEEVVFEPFKSLLGACDRAVCVGERGEPGGRLGRGTSATSFLRSRESQERGN